MLAPSFVIFHTFICFVSVSCCCFCFDAYIVVVLVRIIVVVSERIVVLVIVVGLSVSGCLIFSLLLLLFFVKVLRFCLSQTFHLS